jgi:hypothetical protein
VPSCAALPLQCSQTGVVVILLYMIARSCRWASHMSPVPVASELWHASHASRSAWSAGRHSEHAVNTLLKGFTPSQRPQTWSGPSVVSSVETLADNSSPSFTTSAVATLGATVAGAPGVEEEAPASAVRGSSDLPATSVSWSALHLAHCSCTGTMAMQPL